MSILTGCNVIGRIQNLRIVVLLQLVRAQRPKRVTAHCAARAQLQVVHPPACARVSHLCTTSTWESMKCSLPQPKRVQPACPPYQRQCLGVWRPPRDTLARTCDTGHTTLPKSLPTPCCCRSPLLQKYSHAV